MPTSQLYNCKCLVPSLVSLARLLFLLALPAAGDSCLRSLLHLHPAACPPSHTSIAFIFASTLPSSDIDLLKCLMHLLPLLPTSAEARRLLTAVCRTEIRPLPAVCLRLVTYRGGEE